jgi:2-octaprenyl-6-methoxyphenol hydroxylase
MSVERTDILIAGGGFAGLALAVALSRVSDGGLAVTVADAGPLGLPDAPGTPRQDADPRATALSGSSRRLFETLGIWPALAPHAQAVSEIKLTDSPLAAGVRPVLLRYDPTLTDGSPGMLIVENRFLRAALLAAARGAAGVRLAPVTRIDGAEFGRSHVLATAGQGRSIRARLVVSAEGRTSLLRDAAGIKLSRQAADQIGIVTTVQLLRPHAGTAVQHFLPGGPFAMLPLPNDRACITWSEQAEFGNGLLAADPETFAAALNDRLGNTWGPARLDGPRRGWTLDLFHARDLVAPRLALIGDSARAVHPIAGQGLNLGLRDVAALAEVVIDAARLGQDLGSPIVLQAYQQRRRLDSLSSAAAFDAINRIFSNDWLLLRTARTAGLGTVDRLPVLKRWLVGEAAGETGDVPALLRGVRP